METKTKSKHKSNVPALHTLFVCGNYWFRRRITTQTKHHDCRAATANKLGSGIAVFPRRAAQCRERRQLQFPTSRNALHCRGGVQQGLLGVGQAVLVRAAEPILCCAAPRQIFEQVDSNLGQQKALDNISKSLPALPAPSHKELTLK